MVLLLFLIRGGVVAVVFNTEVVQELEQAMTDVDRDEGSVARKRTDRY